MGTKSESDEESRNPVGVQHVYGRISFVVVEHIEDSTVKLLAGYWTVPSVNKERLVR